MSIARQLIACSDVVIENYRPGVMQRLGLDYDDARKLNPKIIYASISGYGHMTPRAPRGTVPARIFFYRR